MPNTNELIVHDFAEPHSPVLETPQPSLEIPEKPQLSVRTNESITGNGQTLQPRRHQRGRQRILPLLERLSRIY